MKYVIPSIMLMCALLTGQASAQIMPLQNFSYLPWCAGSNDVVDTANHMLGQDQSQLSVKLPTTFSLISLGDKYADCARALSALKVQPAQQQDQLDYVLNALELSTEAHYAAARAAADLIDLSPPSKRTAQERYLFAAAAHDTLLYMTLIKSNSPSAPMVARSADIQTSIAELVPVYGADQMSIVFQGLPK